MTELIYTKPSKKGLTDSGKKAFQIAYDSSGIFEADRPIVRYSRDANEIIEQISECRKKDYKSTARWSASADHTGLLGELAVQRYLGMPSEQALGDFIQGLQGDRGFDVIAAGLNIDVKATKSPTGRFKFNPNNKYSHLADGYLLCYVETTALECWVHLLGWCKRAVIKPYQRFDGKRLFVRAESLARDGILKPVNLLKQPDSTN